MRKFFLAMALLILSRLYFPVQAQTTQGTLTPMMQQTATLAEGESHVWTYADGEIDATIFVETITGSLDPMLEILNEDNEAINSSEDFAPDFSTAALMFVEAGEIAAVRVTASYGEGEYAITVLPGNMLLNWRETFDGSGVDWTEFVSARIENGAMQLQTVQWEANIYTPRSAAVGSDLYLQTTLRFDEVRTNSQAGLMLRGREEANDEFTALHLLIDAEANWSLQQSDITGTDTVLESGTLAAPGENFTLGMLAQGETVQVFADGALLAEIENEPAEFFTQWGVEVVNSIVAFEEVWLGLPTTRPPNFPGELRNWNSANSSAIAAELVEANVIPDGGQRRLVLEPTSYTVANSQQRNFVVGEQSLIFDDVVIGAQLTFTNVVDTGCGLLARHLDEQNKVVAFVDNQNGVGLLWWEHDQLVLNNYTLLPDQAEPTYEIMLVLVDHYAAFYVNGQRLAQNMIARRVGDVGMGLINYADAPATCLYRNFWVWR